MRAIYENGVFRPLEDVPMKEGTEVEVYPLGEQKGNGSKPRSITELGFFGMWKTPSRWFLTSFRILDNNALAT